MRMAHLHQLTLTSLIMISKVEAAPRAPLPYNKPPCFFFRNYTYYFGRSPTRRTVRSTLKTDDPVIEKERRSANYIPNIWDYNSISSAFLASSDNYIEEKYGEEVERMKSYVKGVLGDIVMDDPLERLEFIDVVQRLGLQYHFDAEIKHVLGIIYDNKLTINNNNDPNCYSIFDDDVYATALLFRLLRQHGYNVHQDVFEKFMDSESGHFRESLSGDVKGMLSLYEASFHGRTDEAVVDEAMAFSTASLNKTLRKKTSLAVETRMARMVEHALDMPIHWRPNRLEARWFIDFYSEEPCMDVTLLRLAKLDYNMVQSSHQKNVAELIRWWVGLRLNKMSFFRDRLMEHYLWIALTVFEPQYKAYLIATSKIACMITTIDDCYDVYGTLDELELLTQFVERWDITEIDRLPPGIRSCFLAFFNTTNEIGFELMEATGYNFIPNLQKMWANQCKAYLREAKWYHNGVKPTFKEYLNNGVTTVGGFIMLLSCFLTTANNINEETLDYVSKIPAIMRCSSTILRLNNDLGSSSYELARGDNLKAIECYMAETGSGEGTAREHVENMVRQTWKTMNEVAFISYPFKGPFVDACINFARASQCFDQHGNCHGSHPSDVMNSHIMSILVQPVPLDLYILF